MAAVEYDTKSAPTLDVARVTRFAEDVEADFQKTRSRLRGLVRHWSWTGAEKTRIPLIGVTGDPQNKQPHGPIPVANPKHSFVEVAVSPRYLGCYIDSIEGFHNNINAQQEYRDQLVNTFERHSDNLIFTEMDNTVEELDLTSTGVVYGSFSTLFEHFGYQEIPENDRYFAMCHGAWLDCLEIAQFADRQYLPEGMLPFGKMSFAMGKEFMSFLAFYMTGMLRVTATPAHVKNFVFHGPKVVHGVVQNLVIKPSWENTADAWFLNCSVDHGAKLIPQTDASMRGVVRVLTNSPATTL